MSLLTRVPASRTAFSLPAAAAAAAALLVGVAGPAGAAPAAAPSAHRATGPSCAVSLLTSDSADRSAAVPLAGATVSAAAFVFVDDPAASGRDASGATTPLARVTFALDGAAPGGGTPRPESLAPFDAVGTASDGTARALGTRALPDGPHTVTATWSFRAGSGCEGAPTSASASFRVGNRAPSDPGRCALNVFVASRPDRSDAVPASAAGPLHGAQYLFVTGTRGSRRDLFPASTVLSSVRFSLASAGGWSDAAPFPGTVERTERTAPFDFAGTSADGSARAFDTSAYPDGSYDLLVGFGFVDDTIYGCGEEPHARVAHLVVHNG